MEHRRAQENGRQTVVAQGRVSRKYGFLVKKVTAKK
jgi:hypothetical protein